MFIWSILSDKSFYTTIIGVLIGSVISIAISYIRDKKQEYNVKKLLENELNSNLNILNKYIKKDKGSFKGFTNDEIIKTPNFYFSFDIWQNQNYYFVHALNGNLEKIQEIYNKFYLLCSEQQQIKLMFNMNNYVSSNLNFKFNPLAVNVNNNIDNYNQLFRELSEISIKDIFTKSENNLFISRITCKKL